MKVAASQQQQRWHGSDAVPYAEYIPSLFHVAFRILEDRTSCITGNWGTVQKIGTGVAEEFRFSRLCCWPVCVGVWFDEQNRLSHRAYRRARAMVVSVAEGV